MSSHIYQHWSWQAIADFFEYYSFAHAWSNWLLEVQLIGLLIASLSIDKKQQRLSAMSGGFLALLGINLAAAATHGIEQTPAFQILAKNIAFINFALLGFASIFFEFFVLHRVRLLKQQGISGFDKFPFKSVTALIVIFFILFQLINGFTRKEPQFIYAIVDYGASLLMMMIIAIYVLFTVNKYAHHSPNSKNHEPDLMKVKFDKRFEVYTLTAIAFFLLASICQQLPVFQQLLPNISGVKFHYNDLYHLLLLPAFSLLYMAKRCENSIIIDNSM